MDVDTGEIIISVIHIGDNGGDGDGKNEGDECYDVGVSECDGDNDDGCGDDGE